MSNVPDQDTPDGSTDFGVNPSKPVKPASAKHQPQKSQFRISTLISWMAVVVVMLVSTDAQSFFQSSEGNMIGPNGIAERIKIALFVSLFLFPALTCIPAFVDKLIYPQYGIEFGTFGKVWLTIAVAIYSALTLMLATAGFTPDWKGYKGHSWLYYLLDSEVGLTLWPIYFAGAIAFISGIVNPGLAKRSPAVLIAVLINALISFWYVFAVLFLNFTNGDRIFAIVPGSCGICYAIYTVLILRNHEFKSLPAGEFKKWIGGWISFFAASVAVKIPLAIKFYNRLPDEEPERCFVVTAATKGHSQIVASWFDDSMLRVLNQQLLTFWSFESWLKESFPRFHRGLRAIYNRVGPVVARQIRFPWQADVVYCLLKPLEWLARLVLMLKR